MMFYLLRKCRGGAIYVRPDGVSFALYKRDSIAAKMQTLIIEEDLPEPVPMEIYRVDMQFNRAAKAPNVSGLEMTDDYNNYYLAHCPDGITNVRKYHRVYYEEVYKNIDFVLYANAEGKVQYDFIVKPGGNPKQINFAFRGAVETAIQHDGSLKVTTPLGDIIQDAPYSYLISSFEGRQRSGNIDEIPSRFFLNSDNSLTFAVGDYDKTKTLVIDPTTRLWGTYYGGSSYDFGQSVATDNSGNVYLAGTTSSTNAIATTSSHQSSRGGTYQFSDDAFLVKFNSNGVRLWGTYYGGSGSDYGFFVDIDGSDNIYLAGYTSSTTAIATSGSHQSTIGGGTYDAFLVKFNSSGVRQWGTYYGGSDNDRGFSVITDASGYVYLAGFAGSNEAIATSGSHQSAIGGGDDAFLVKFNSDGARQWGTYYGGGGYDYAYSVATDNSGYVYLAGTAASKEAIATTGSHQSTYAGIGNCAVGDAFLVKFNSNGIRQWGTYYGGCGTDHGFSVITDASGYVYLAGITGSEEAIATSGSYQSAFGGDIDAFIVKFNSNGARQWGTYYGGSENEGYYVYATDVNGSIAVDSNGYIYLAGYTSSTTAIATSGSHQSTIGGGNDAFIVKFNSNGARQWGTYYGGNTDDCGHSVTTDGGGNVYLVGWTGSDNSIATPGAHQTTLGTPYKDAFLVKFSEIDLKISIFTENYFCQGENLQIPYTVEGTFNTGNLFTAQLSNATGSFASPTNIGTLTSSSSGTINATLPNGVEGIGFRIRVISSDPSFVGTNNGSDLTINPLPQPTITGDTTFCCANNNTSYSTSTEANIQYQWTASGGTIQGSSTGSSVNVIWGSAGTGTIKIVQTNSQTGCKDSIERNVIINPLPQPTITGDTTFCCANNNTSYFTSTEANIQYQWTASGGTIQGSATESNINVLWSSAGAGTIKIVQTNSQTGCKDSIERNVIINPLPQPTITGDSTLCCANNNTSYTTSNEANIQYQWSASGGTIQGSATESNVNVLWGSAGTGTIRIVQTNSQTGCKDYLERNVIINPQPMTQISGSGSVSQNEDVNYTSNLSTGVSYQWTVENGSIQGSSNQQNVLVRWSNVGNGKVILRHINATSNCEASDTLNVIISAGIPPLVLNIVGNKQMCSGSSVQIGNTDPASGGLPPYNYKWSPSTGLNNYLIPNPIAMPAITTEYTLTVTDKRDSTATAIVTVVVNPLPDKPKITLDGNSLVSNYSSGNQWFKDASPIKDATSNRYTPSVSGEYSVQHTNSLGCVSEMSIQHHFTTSVLEPMTYSLTILYPNPANDIINIFATFEEESSATLRIFDLNGNQILIQEFNEAKSIEFETDISNLSSGLYQIVISTKDDILLGKFIKL